MLKAREIMTTAVQTVTPGMDLGELARRFVETGFATFPVVDGDGRLVGIVSETDLLQQEAPLRLPRLTALFDAVFYLESEKKFQQQVQRITARTVGEICSREVVTCTPDTDLGTLAGLMTRHRIHLLPVVDGGRLAGVVARVDVLRGLGR